MCRRPPISPIVASSSSKSSAAPNQPWKAPATAAAPDHSSAPRGSSARNRTPGSSAAARASKSRAARASRKRPPADHRTASGPSTPFLPSASLCFVAMASNVRPPRLAVVGGSPHKPQRPAGPLEARPWPAMGEQSSGVRRAEIVAAFSLATDLGLGQPMEHVLRSWIIATRLGEHLGVEADQRANLYYVATL